ncbi:hypothetical protein [uncultured Psychroserpens sp.]|uniref:hypothetical protein n=1 Tax=uncultured Psychroserpens sp. TaxID=255436 RepID=UPI00261F280A|nr:hypothetical protein [uncultured Psychroserpens sp.]
MKKRITALLIFSILLIIIFPLIYIFDKESLKDPDGNGTIAATVTIITGFFGILIDYLLFKTIKNKLTLNLIELVLIAGFVYLCWPNK